MKKTRRSLFTSLVTLLLCSAMFVGSTFAWFTDTVSNTGNKIQAGTLKIGLEQYKNTGTDAEPEYEFVDISDNNEPIFNYDKWEPGYSEVVALRVVNNGTLALKYMINIVANGDASKLAEAIDVYTKIINPTTTVTLPESFAEVKADTSFKVTPLTEVLSYGEGAAHGALLPEGSTDAVEAKLEANESAAMIVVLHMKEEAGNEYQDLSLGSTFDINVFATQYTYEKDGFNSDQYDIDTPWMGEVAEVTPVDNVYEISNGAELAYIAQLVNSGIDLDGKTVKLVKDIDLNNVNWTPIGSDGKAFNGTFDGLKNADATELKDKYYTIINLNVKETRGAGLFGYCFNYAEIRNVNIKNAKVSGVAYAGVISGSTYANVSNCHVEDATINVVGEFYGTKYVDGAKAGAIVGYLREGSSMKVTDCSAKNVTINGYRDLGGIVGALHGDSTVTGNTCENVVINQGDYTGYESGDYTTLGAIYGRNVSKTGGTLQENTSTGVTINKFRIADVSNVDDLINEINKTGTDRASIINVAAGTYDVTIDNQMQVLNAGVKIIGAGVDNTFINLGNSWCGEAGMMIAADNVTLSDMTITSSRTGVNDYTFKVDGKFKNNAQPSVIKNVTLKNLKVSSINSTAVLVQNITGIATLDNIEVPQYSKFGLYFRCASAVVSNSTVRECSGDKNWKKSIGAELSDTDTGFYTLTIQDNNNLHSGEGYYFLDYNNNGIEETVGKYDITVPSTWESSTSGTSKLWK